MGHSVGCNAGAAGGCRSAYCVAVRCLLSNLQGMHDVAQFPTSNVIESSWFDAGDASGVVGRVSVVVAVVGCMLMCCQCC